MSGPDAIRHRRPRWRGRFPGATCNTGTRPERYGRRHSEDEIQLVSDWLLYLTPQQIARRLGRTVRAIEDICKKHHIAATRHGYLTSTEAARKTGLSPQYLTELARAKKLRAIRIRGGRWWLFNPKTLDRFKGGFMAKSKGGKAGKGGKGGKAGAGGGKGDEKEGKR